MASKQALEKRLAAAEEKVQQREAHAVAARTLYEDAEAECSRLASRCLRQRELLPPKKQELEVVWADAAVLHA